MQESMGSRRGLTPDTRLRQAVQVPPSKSLAQRALVAATLTHGKTRLVGIARSGACDDVGAALGVSLALGAEHHWLAPRALTVTGTAPGHCGGLAARGALEVGESGTLARLVTAVAGLCGRGALDVHAAGSLLARESPALFAALAQAGVKSARPAGSRPAGWPVTLTPRCPGPDLFLSAPRSSQELSALLVAASAYPDAIQVHVEGPVPSAPYVELTVGLLARFGVEVVRVVPRGPGIESYEVRGVLTPPEEPLALEPDVSAAAVALCGAAILGTELRVPGELAGSRQGDLAIASALTAFGAEAGLDSGGLWVRGRVARGATLDLGPTPDLAPALVAVAVDAALRLGSTSLFTGLETLIHKETDRLRCLAEGAGALGLDVAADRERGRLEIGPGAGAEAGEITLSPEGDHRMAFAFALFGLARPGVFVDQPGVVAKSWPTFWSDLLRE